MVWANPEFISISGIQREHLVKYGVFFLGVFLFFGVFSVVENLSPEQIPPTNSPEQIPRKESPDQIPYLGKFPRNQTFPQKK
jgi:hypothetical protein